MKKLWLLCLALTLLLTGCAGDTVIYQVQCDHEDTPQTAPQPTPDDGVEEVKTGLAILADRGGSRSADRAVFEVTVAAVTVDENGVLRQVELDGVFATVTFDSTGTLTDDISAAILSRVQQNDDYGMAAISGLQDGWYQQAQALEEAAEGRPVDTLRLTDHPQVLIEAVEKAAAAARYLGAGAEDELVLSLQADIAGSLSATDSQPGRARLSCDAAAVTFSDEVITACSIDSVQADVPFDAMGTITDDVSEPAKTKTELGEDYGMKAYGGAKYEWYEQAQHFARYVTGKTAAQVAGILVSDGKATQADLYASVTISITPFQQLIARAEQGRAGT